MAVRLGSREPLSHSSQSLTGSADISRTEEALHSPHSTNSLLGEDAAQIQGGEVRHGTAAARPSLSFLNGLALVMGLQIGSGIFSAPSQISNQVSSPGEGVLIWVTSGLLVWTGAASFIELGLAIPQNGGVQEYLRYCYGDFPGFLFTWIWVLISKPAAMAMIALVFSDHLSYSLFSLESKSFFVSKAIALLGLSFITVTNCLGAITGARIANGFLVLKLFAVYSIALFGIVMIIKGRGNGVPTSPHGWFGDVDIGRRSEVWQKLGHFVTGMYGALFCYGGWETIGFVAGELKDPYRDLPRIINVAMLLAIIGFSFMNIALYLEVPMNTMRIDPTPVLALARSSLGSTDALLYSLIISISSMGALNANVFATGRLCVAASRRKYFPKILGNMHVGDDMQEHDYYEKHLSSVPRHLRNAIIMFARRTAHLRLEKKVPVYAMVMNGLIASIYIIAGTFDSLVTFVGISEYLFFFLAVLGIRHLRLRKSATESLWRTWTLNPVLFCILSGVLVIRGIVSEPAQGFGLLVVILCGWLGFRSLGIPQ